MSHNFSLTMLNTRMKEIKEKHVEDDTRITNKKQQTGTNAGGIPNYISYNTQPLLNLEGLLSIYMLHT